ncbi:MAG: LarC family nickel insertion protein [Hyphomicrobiaceae bacterium]|nr:MAG: LarC family nickel insertion protein [Hyphomicrobiaceae bacterium]
MSGRVILLMAQIDDAPGELLGEVMQTFAEKGAKNVQLLSSLGKKGRPGYVLLVDILADQEPEFAAVLGADLGVWGYRVLHSEHKHFNIERYTTTAEVRLGGAIKSFPMRIKRILDGDKLLRIKAEHDDLSAISAAFRTDGKAISLTVLKSHVEAAVGTAVPTEKIHVNLD